MRTHYFGELDKGASTEKFWREITTAIHEHDIALKGLQRIRSVTEN
jgi:hypothetical protein